MPIYEALSDKLTVVLDIGSAYTKLVVKKVKNYI